jgi:uncharacterized membrane protein YgcG
MRLWWRRTPGIIALLGTTLLIASEAIVQPAASQPSVQPTVVVKGTTFLERTRDGRERVVAVVFIVDDGAAEPKLWSSPSLDRRTLGRKALSIFDLTVTEGMKRLDFVDGDRARAAVFGISGMDGDYARIVKYPIGGRRIVIQNPAEVRDSSFQSGGGGAGGGGAGGGGAGGGGAGGGGAGGGR